MNDNIEWEGLGNGIVEQAHEDYLEALLLEHRAVLILNKAAKLKRSVLSFYGNEWYYALTQVDPATLIDTARKQADYIIWQRNHQCATCEIETCPHKVERVNWKMWSDGRKVCVKERDKRSATYKSQLERLMNGMGLTEEQADMAIHLCRNDKTGAKS